MTQTRQRPGSGTPDAIQISCLDDGNSHGTRNTDPVPSRTAQLAHLRTIKAKLTNGDLQDATPIAAPPIIDPGPPEPTGTLPAVVAQRDDKTWIDLDLEELETMFVGRDLGWALRELRAAGTAPVPTCIRTSTHRSPDSIRSGGVHACRSWKCDACAHKKGLDEVERTIDTLQTVDQVHIGHLTTAERATFTEQHKKRRQRATDVSPTDGSVIVPIGDSTFFVIAGHAFDNAQTVELRIGLAQFTHAMQQRIATAADPRSARHQLSRQGFKPTNVPESSMEETHIEETGTDHNDGYTYSGSLRGHVTYQDIEIAARRLRLDIVKRGQDGWEVFGTQDQLDAFERQYLTVEHGRRTPSQLAEGHAARRARLDYENQLADQTTEIYR